VQPDTLEFALLAAPLLIPCLCRMLTPSSEIELLHRVHPERRGQEDREPHSDELSERELVPD
jgi:hypothetical protein